LFDLLLVNDLRHMIGQLNSDMKSKEAELSEANEIINKMRHDNEKKSMKLLHAFKQYAEVKNKCSNW